MLPVALPTDLDIKVTFRIQLELMARLKPQLLVCENVPLAS